MIWKLGKREKKSNLEPKVYQDRDIFPSLLPADIDWDELNRFLNATSLHRSILTNNWCQTEAYTDGHLSDTSKKCLECLHADLCSCYGGPFAVDENGHEDRHKEYRILEEKLFSKYSGLDEEILKRIHADYLIADR